MSYNMTPREGFTLFRPFLNFLCSFQTMVNSAGTKNKENIFFVRLKEKHHAKTLLIILRYIGVHNMDRLSQTMPSVCYLDSKKCYFSSIRVSPSATNEI